MTYQAHNFRQDFSAPVLLTTSTEAAEGVEGIARYGVITSISAREVRISFPRGQEGVFGNYRSWAADFTLPGESSVMAMFEATGILQHHNMSIVRFRFVQDQTDDYNQIVQTIANMRPQKMAV